MLTVDQVLEKSLSEQKVQGINNMLIIRRDDKPEESSGGIILPGTQYVSPNWCTVMAVPKRVKDRFGLRKCKLKVGDRVFVRPAEGLKEWDLDKTLQVCHYQSVYAIEKNGKVLPFDHKILVKKPEAPEKFIGSALYIPDSVRNAEKENEDRGEIVALGSEVNKTEFKKGMMIVFDFDKAVTIDKEGSLFSIPEDYILGVLD